MHASATLFFDVCVQRDFWMHGAWPVLGAGQARNVARLFTLGAGFSVRQGGTVCAHGAGGAAAAAELPMHCCAVDSGSKRPEGCHPRLPMQVWCAKTAGAPETVLEREHATYIDSGCLLAPDDGSRRLQAFRHVTAGVRDAVVFGAGIEHGIDRAVDALLRHRIRTHVVLDAVGTGDEVVAQTIVAAWKRRGVDGLTVDVLERLLTAGSTPRLR